MCFADVKHWRSFEAQIPPWTEKKGFEQWMGKKETDKNRWDGKKRCVKENGESEDKNRRLGDKITSLIEEYARRKEKMQHDEKKGKKDSKQEKP